MGIKTNREKEIIELITAGDEKGLEKLLDLYQGYIIYVVKAILGKYPEDMDECVNDIKLKLWENLCKFNFDISSLKTYIAAISRNTALDRLKTMQRQRRTKNNDMELIDESFKDNSPSTEDKVMEKEMMRILADEINKLPEYEKELFVRRYYYCQSISQISMEVNKSEKSVESKLGRIKKKLKSKIKEV